VLKLTAARSNNIAYRECEHRNEHAEIEEAKGENGNSALLSLTRKGVQQPEPTSAAKSPHASCNKPDLGFTAPLTLLAMLAGTLLAARVAIANDWRVGSKRYAKAREHSRTHRKELDALRVAEPDAEQTLAQSDLYLAAMAEQEAATTNNLFARLVGEYERWCGVFGCAPRSLRLPEVSDPTELLIRMLRLEEPSHHGQSATQAASAADDPIPPSGAPDSDPPQTSDPRRPREEPPPPPHGTTTDDPDAGWTFADEDFPRRPHIVDRESEDRPDEDATDDGVPAGWFRSEDDRT
jgi:hypothetical protein